jgi:hypothetical protein
MRTSIVVSYDSGTIRHEYDAYGNHRIVLTVPAFGSFNASERFGNWASYPNQAVLQVDDRFLIAFTDYFEEAVYDGRKCKLDP